MQEIWLEWFDKYGLLYQENVPIKSSKKTTITFASLEFSIKRQRHEIDLSQTQTNADQTIFSILIPQNS